MAKPENLSGIHRIIWNRTWFVILLGVIMFLVGNAVAGGEAADGTVKQTFFGTLTIVGIIFTAGGLLVAIKKRLR